MPGCCLVAVTRPPPSPAACSGAFDRLAAPHGERGYRLGLIEAGRLVERLVHAAASLGLAAIETGDFYDREFDVLLGLDGVTAGTLALVAVGSGGEVGRRA